MSMNLIKIQNLAGKQRREHYFQQSCRGFRRQISIAMTKSENRMNQASGNAMKTAAYPQASSRHERD
ncbi:hypothetical protein [Agrobacterium bohemicum]|uniref:hypothetical protein n=1 Tax=Agrobacterium bohemicum TaxID=2052828 RepID=UPI00131A01CC|nr:hypothetical protein [Agrobacterium bohemicum]